MRSDCLRTFIFLLLSLPFTAHAGFGWQEVGPASATFMAASGNHAMVVDSGGNVYIGGNYRNARGTYSVYKWNGKTWSELGQLNASNSILALAIDAAGNVYAGGAFKNGAPRNNFFVSKWDGFTWKELSNDTSYLKANSSIRAIALDAKGNVYAAGQFSDGTPYYKGRPYVAKWDGAKWATVGTIDSLVSPVGSVIYAMTLDPAGNLYAGGSFRDAGGNPLLMKWNGSKWIALPPISSTQPVGASFLMMAVSDKMGNVYTSGTISNSGSTIYIAKWNGSTWSEVSSPASKLGVKMDRGIFSMAVTPNGAHLYVAGFTEKEPPANKAYVAHWDGVTWSELGPSPYPLHIGVPGAVYELGLDGSGNIYATGDFINSLNNSYVAKYANYGHLPGPISVPALLKEGDIRIYPLPNKGQFTVTGPWLTTSSNGTASIRVSNMHGQVVFAAKAKPSGDLLAVDISGQAALPEGFYQLQVVYGGKVYAQALQIGSR